MQRVVHSSSLVDRLGTGPWYLTNFIYSTSKVNMTTVQYGAFKNVLNETPEKHKLSQNMSLTRP
jgi:hypothetical protein